MKIFMNEINSYKTFAKFDEIVFRLSTVVIQKHNNTFSVELLHSTSALKYHSVFAAKVL